MKRPLKLVVALKAFSKEIKKNSTQGFSLIEILVALTLLGIAGTFVAGKIFEKLEEGQIQAASIQMNALKSNLKEFRRKCGFYPASGDGLEALVEAPTSKECKNYPPEGFLEDGVVPADPWEEEYAYKLDGSQPEIISGGPDKEIGTEDDISSIRRKKSRDN